jgi:membrane fusion protein, copper/silver efflux system
MRRLMLSACFIFPLAVLMGKATIAPSSAKLSAAVVDPKEDAEEKEKIKKNLAKLTDAERKLALEQLICPIEKEPLGSMGVPQKVTLKGKTIFVCCKGCIESAQKKPDETLKIVAELKKKNKAKDKDKKEDK